MSDSREHRNLKNQIRIALGKLDHVVVWNNESGGTPSIDGLRFIRYGVGKGGSDLLGIVKLSSGVGRFFALEVKTGKARASKEQEMFIALVRRYGGYASIVRSVQDALTAIEEAQYEDTP